MQKIFMTVDTKTLFKRICASVMGSFVGRLFLDKKFFYYTCVGVVVSVLNVFFLWLFIDVFHISTVIAGITVVGITFILRYVLFVFFKIL